MSKIRQLEAWKIVEPRQRIFFTKSDNEKQKLKNRNSISSRSRNLTQSGSVANGDHLKGVNVHQVRFRKASPLYLAVPTQHKITKHVSPSKWERRESEIFLLTTKTSHPSHTQFLLRLLRFRVVFVRLFMSFYGARCLMLSLDVVLKFTHTECRARLFSFLFFFLSLLIRKIN